MEILIIIGVWSGLGWCLGLFLGIFGVVICYMLSQKPTYVFPVQRHARVTACQRCGQGKVVGDYCSNCEAAAVDCGPSRSC